MSFWKVEYDDAYSSVCLVHKRTHSEGELAEFLRSLDEATTVYRKAILRDGLRVSKVIMTKDYASETDNQYPHPYLFYQMRNRDYLVDPYQWIMPFHKVLAVASLGRNLGLDQVKKAPLFWPEEKDAFSWTSYLVAAGVPVPSQLSLGRGS